MTAFGLPYLVRMLRASAWLTPPKAELRVGVPEQAARRTPRTPAGERLMLKSEAGLGLGFVFSLALRDGLLPLTGIGRVARLREGIFSLGFSL